MNDEHWMRLAIDEARAAAALGEVPVGALLVDAQGQVLARAHNRRELDADPTAHAELLVVKQATGVDKPGLWRLPPATLYVTLEPCIMCMGVLLLARLERLVYGATDPKAGATDTLYRLGEDPRLNHQIDSSGGVLATECGALLSDFFRELRSRRKATPV